MFLFNKLIRVDLISVMAALLLAFVHNGFWAGFLQGVAAVSIIISAGGHYAHYKRTKRFY